MKRKLTPSELVIARIRFARERALALTREKYAPLAYRNSAVRDTSWQDISVTDSKIDDSGNVISHGKVARIDHSQRRKDANAKQGLCPHSHVTITNKPKRGVEPTVAPSYKPYKRNGYVLQPTNAATALLKQWGYDENGQPL